MRTLLFCIFLHALDCFNFSSQMPNKGGKGGIDWIFTFPDPYWGHEDLFQAFKLTNNIFCKYYLFFQMDNEQTFFLTFVTTSKTSVLKTSVLQKNLYASKLNIFIEIKFIVIKPFFTPPPCLLDFSTNSDTLFIRETRVTALTTFTFFARLMCIYFLPVSILYVLYASPSQNTSLHFLRGLPFIFDVIFTCPSSISLPLAFFVFHMRKTNRFFVYVLLWKIMLDYHEK